MCLSHSSKQTAKKDIQVAGMVINRSLQTDDINALEVGLIALIEGFGMLKSLKKQEKVNPENTEKKGN